MYNKYDPLYCGWPPYMKIYHDARSVCEEQHNIVEEGLDLTLLSSVFGALPQLKGVGLHFRATTRQEKLLDLYMGEMSIAEKSYEHHIRVILNAIKKARKGGISIDSLDLRGFDLRGFDILDRDIRDQETLSEIFGELVGCVQNLRLTQSSSALELLSRSTLKLCQLEMCDIIVQHTDLKHFLEINKKYIRSIGFHNVNTVETNWLEETKLSSGAICSMLNVPQSTPVREVDCGCSRLWEKGQRLLLK
jgi:hypothetical protein